MVSVDLELEEPASKRFVLHSAAHRHHDLEMGVLAAVHHILAPVDNQGSQEETSDTDSVVVAVVPGDKPG